MPPDAGGWRMLRRVLANVCSVPAKRQHVFSKNNQLMFPLIPANYLHLRPLLDVLWTCTLLPYTKGVSQEKVVGGLTKPALGEQLAATNVHGKPGELQQDFRRSFTGLHHYVETRFFPRTWQRTEVFDLKLWNNRFCKILKKTQQMRSGNKQ